MEKLNKEFRIVFQPREPALHGGKRRFAVGAYSLHKYIGEKNAKTALSRAFNSLDDVTTVRLRKHGRIDFYVK